MKKRRADSLIEILIAFLIIIIAISISVLASSQVGNLKREAMIKSHIYDLAYSAAEEQLATSTILNSETKEVAITQDNYEMIFEISTEAAQNLTIFGEDATSATLTVNLKDNEDYMIEMIIIPKQQ